MNFHKDLLVLDLEMTGLDPAKHEIIQIGAVLLDKKTLLEKQSFMTYIKPKKWQNRDSVSMKINNIDSKILKTAPDINSAIHEFDSLFNNGVILCVWGGIIDTVFLKKAYEKINLTYPFDYHVFNIWSLAFPYLALQNQLTDNQKYSGFSLDTLLKKFKIPSPESRHDALVDSRLAAEILRKIITKLSV